MLGIVTTYMRTGANT